jgi:DNA-binding beta-propeller fold protein YncE
VAARSANMLLYHRLGCVRASALFTLPTRSRSPLTSVSSAAPKAPPLPTRQWHTTLVFLATAAAALALEPVPPASRIPVTLGGTLAAPADDPMHMPTDVAVDSTGRVYVADGAKDRIVIFRPDGVFDRVVDAIGDDKLKRPVGLCVDVAGQLWIADSGNHRVLVIAPDGRLLARIEAPAPEGGRPFEPTDVVVTPDGRRAYIPDNHNHRLVIRDNQTGVVTFMGRFGEGLGQFRWPFMVAIAPDGYVYITEAIGARAQRLSPTDRWAGQVGRWGVELGQLYRPKGITVDGQARPYISDSTLNVVQVFGAMGGVVGVLTDPTGRPYRFQHPMGMAFDTRGRLYLVELLANRVAILNLPPGFAPPKPTTRPTTRPAGEVPR